MGYAERISQEIHNLTPEQQAEVLEFVSHIKEGDAFLLPALTLDQA